MKFEVGDIITGLPDSRNHYEFTTNKAEMKVLKTDCNKTEFGDDIEVEIIKSDDHPRIIGETFLVHSEYFTKVNKALVIEKVIFSDNKTIVFWTDSTKTIVTCAKDDQFNKETGIAMAVMKKYLGNNTIDYHMYFDKFVGE